jgi:glycosyltransferase involved in cell wall biosynthesis
MSIQILKSTEVDIVIFYLAYPYYLLPLFTASILRKKTCEVVTRSRPKSIPEKILSFQDPTIFRLLSGISPESKGLIKELNLNRYEKKLLTAGARFIDTDLYSVQNKISERHKIGFISRIKKEKGICEFLKAIKIISSSKKGLKFLIAGDGDLTEVVKKECERIEKEYDVTIEFIGWVGDEMPHYLNELKLLVLPTKSDALPTIILESMSCGTPVLVSSVGSIGDVIDDSVTGFILKDNSPETIANSILRTMNNDHTEYIIENALNLIEKDYTYNSAVKRWKKILSELYH